MLSRGRLLFIAVSLLSVLVVVSSTLYAASTRDGDDGTDSPYKYLSVFMEVFGLVNKAYVDPPENAQLMAGAFEGTIDALDPFSLYIPADQVTRYEQTRQVGSSRSGLVLLKERGVAYVVAVEEGSPADEAGIEPGDILSEIQGLRTRRTPLFEVRAILAGAPGTTVTVERLRQGHKKQLSFDLREYDRPAVVLEAHRGVGVLRIPAFYDGAVPSIEQSLATIVRGDDGLPGLEQVDRLVIDLRGVAGGDEAAAYRAAGLFVGGELGTLQQRDEALEVFSAEAPRFAGTVVLLTNRATQGAAEVFASILHQGLEAKLVGERTFGHSGRHTLVPLSDGARLQLTDAFYTGPDREPINSSLDPDVRVRIWADDPTETSDEVDAKDLVLEAGLDAVLGIESEERELAA